MSRAQLASMFETLTYRSQMISTREASSRSERTPKCENTFLAFAVVRAGSASTVLLLFGSPRLAASAYHSSA